MTQEERLDYLVDAFMEDSGEYIEVPYRESMDQLEKRRVLRSLMNIRMPHAMATETIQVQDEYLSERIRENGVVTLSEIPTVKEQYGSTRSHADRISIWQGDITRLAVDAIVNAANSQMLGCFVPMHSCIDNCIHTYAGIQLRAECNRRMNQLRARYGKDYEQPTAVPMLTDGYNLPSRKVIHIVGPIVPQGVGFASRYLLTDNLRQDLADCYTRTLDLCLENGLRSVAFCCISTGVFRFPNREAAEIAVRNVEEWLQIHEGSMDRVIFNVFKDEDKEYYENECKRD